MKKVNESLFDKFENSKLDSASSVKGGAEGATGNNTCTGPDTAPDCGDIQGSTHFEADSVQTTIEFDHNCSPKPPVPVNPTR
jgi:hypothetical protein